MMDRYTIGGVTRRLNLAVSAFDVGAQIKSGWQFGLAIEAKSVKTA